MEISDEKKKEILELIAIPGMDVQDISEKLGLDFDSVMEVLSDEYMKHNLDYGRRLCCRF